jgi:hypothetical protein
MVNGQAGHQVARITIPAERAHCRGQQRITKARGRAVTERYSRLAGPVPAQGQEVAVPEGPDEFRRDPAIGQIEDRAGIRVALCRNPLQIGVHRFIIAGQTP